LRNIPKFLKHVSEKINQIEMVAPTGFEPVFGRGRVFVTLFANSVSLGSRKFGATN